METSAEFKISNILPLSQKPEILHKKLMQNSVKCLLYQLLRLVHLPQRVKKMCGILYPQQSQNEW